MGVKRVYLEAEKTPESCQKLYLLPPTFILSPPTFILSPPTFILSPLTFILRWPMLYKSGLLAQTVRRHCALDPFRTHAYHRWTCSDSHGSISPANRIRITSYSHGGQQSQLCIQPLNWRFCHVQLDRPRTRFAVHQG